MSKAEPKHPDIERILLDQAEIKAKIAEMGRLITSDYRQTRPLLVGILKGSVLFLSDLMREIELDCEIDFISLASYSGMSSGGVVQLLLDLRENISGRDVLVVEDIVDTGLTLSYLQQNLKTRHPKSLELCTLLDKPDCRKVKIQPKYVGFKIPKEFVV